ncbi:MAG: hypothetical protein ACNS60_14000 [Candidatus Cyclobacteriaceae bacterium M2_1C_046]
MKSIINISVLILFTIAAQAHQMHSVHLVEPVEKVSRAVVEFTSLGNDFADIKMEMHDNGKFIIRIKPKDGKSLKLKGRWEKHQNVYKLKFKKSDVAISNLFNMNDPNRFQIIDDLNITFSGYLSSLWIWGIQCKRSETI